MGLMRWSLRQVGTIGGGIVKGATYVTGKVVSKKFEKTGEYIEELGDSIYNASRNTMDNAGHFIDGTIQSTYGLVTKDEFQKQQGWNDIKESSGKAINGIKSTISYTVKSAGTTFNGIRTGDREKFIAGAKNLGKVVAVTTCAIGVIDIIDGLDTADAETIDTRNDHLTGEVHPETGVPFVEKTIELPTGDVVTGSFPVFESHFHVVLAEELYLESDHSQFQIANDMLYQAIQEQPNLANDLGLSLEDVQELEHGVTPDGYVWHHHEEPGILQLVDEEIHQQTGHTGGREIWGGGSGYR